MLMSYLKKAILVFPFFGLFLQAYSQTFEIYKSDTINQTTDGNAKTGRWISFYTDSPGQIEREGFYENNRKTGIWKAYYKNGKLKSEITYVNNQPDGYAKLYYDNGKLSEEGFWKGTKWVGQYKYYHENGNTAYEWSFNENGKRTGVQKYYHENGKLRIQGEWIDGKENGVISEYDTNGNIRSEKVFAEGTINVNSSKFYAQKKVSVDEIPDDTNATVGKTPIETNETQTNYQSFDGNGFFKLYNAMKKMDREGEFRAEN